MALEVFDAEEIEEGPDAFLNFSGNPNNLEALQILEIGIFGGFFIMMVIFYLMDLKPPQWATILTLVLLNIPYGCVYTYNVNNWYGPEYLSQLQHASAVYNGERDYSAIYSHRGRVSKPAGYIYYCLFGQFVHMLAGQYGEQVMKFLHVIVHTVTQVYATKIAYLFFGENLRHFIKENSWTSMRAQVIAFALLSNYHDRQFYANMMCSDEVMSMFLIMSIYYLGKGQTIKGITYFSLALGMNSLLILLLPLALLCSRSTSQGTLALSILLILQLLLSLPFTFLGETTF